jgi:DNA-binding LacI/PurR family transcriptional regulator
MRSSKPSKRRPTLADVAAASDVSIATASYVLAGRQDVSVSAATRARVIDSARELGYRRNSVAAALRRGRGTTIAIVSSERPMGADGDVVLALAEAATVREIAATVYIGKASHASATEFDGVISIGSPELQWRAEGLATVEIGGDGACQVQMDDFGGARELVMHLLELGHRRVVHFAGHQGQPSAQERLRGFLESALEGNLNMEASPVVHTWEELGGTLSPPNRPTALFLEAASMAPMAYRLARSLGLRIPDDLSIVAFGDDSRALSVDPSLTTARIPVTELSVTAIDLLTRLLAGEQVPERTLISSALVVRESTAKA